MRTRGTKEIVPSLDGRSFIALLESGELWRHDTLTHTWVRVLNPDEMAAEQAEKEAKKAAEEDQGYQKHAEAPRMAQEQAEATTYATVSVSEAERLEALWRAPRFIAGREHAMGDALWLARWVISKFGGRDAG
jgi:hypothetical protein